MGPGPCNIAYLKAAPKIDNDVRASLDESLVACVHTMDL